MLTHVGIKSQAAGACLAIIASVEKGPGSGLFSDFEAAIKKEDPLS